jgi:CRP/FNR family cyclic AMP-dependent transcriptional regulator
LVITPLTQSKVVAQPQGEAIDGSNRTGQEKVRLRPEEVPCHYRRGQESCGLCEETNDFAQGDAADAVFYIQKGKVRLTVVSESGKEAMIGILNSGDFFGEGALAGRPLRMGSASAMTDYDLLQIEKKAMTLALHREQASPTCS